MKTMYRNLSILMIGASAIAFSVPAGAQVGVSIGSDDGGGVSADVGASVGGSDGGVPGSETLAKEGVIYNLR